MPAEGVGGDLDVDPVPAVLARLGGALVSDPVDRDEGAITMAYALRSAAPHGLGEGWGARCQRVECFPKVAMPNPTAGRA